MHTRANRRLDPFLFVFLVIFVWQFGCPTLAQSQPQVDLTGKNVLVLHSHEANALVFLGTDRGLSTALQFSGVPILNQFFVSLDLRRNPDPRYKKHLIEEMRIRCGHRKIDVIITMFPEALEFVLRDCRDIFSDVPIVALYLPQSLEPPKTDRYIIGHSVTPDILGTFEIALKLVPGAKRVYVVSGTHEVDRRIEDQAHRDLKKWETRLEFYYLSHMSFQDILATLSNAPPDSVVLLLIFTQDIAGKGYTSPEMAQRLSQVSAAPIFGLLDASLGFGITGGSLINFERIGSKAGELALDVLRGIPPPRSASGILDVPPMPMFDWRQLKRWNLSVSALPKGSIVINRELTLWDFKYYILGGIAILLAQTALVIGLLMQRRRKEVAEISLRQKTEELDQFFNVTLDLLGIANTDGYFLRLNPAMEKILGYTREEFMAKRFFEFIHPDDLDRTQESVSLLTSQKKISSFENRYCCKDGTYRWLEWSSAPAGNLIYAAARDVTERKQAEQTLQEKERVLLQNQYELRKLTGRLISAHEEERSRLARELHDDLSQRLAVISIDAGKLEQQLINSPGPIKEKLNEMKNQVVKISADIHNLARQLHPSILDDLGLVRAIESECAAFLKREGVNIVFSRDNISNVAGKEVSLTLYRIVQEGLRNISKHACANHVSVSLKGFDQGILLSVEDDGIGFDLAEARLMPGLGLSSLRERVRLVNGELSIQSQPGEGTVITVKAPLDLTTQG
jgi:PAS domain S-box-containing protein